MHRVRPFKELSILTLLLGTWYFINLCKNLYSVKYD